MTYCRRRSKMLSKMSFHLPQTHTLNLLPMLGMLPTTQSMKPLSLLKTSQPLLRSLLPRLSTTPLSPSTKQLSQSSLLSPTILIKQRTWVSKRPTSMFNRRQNRLLSQSLTMLPVLLHLLLRLSLPLSRPYLLLLRPQPIFLSMLRQSILPW